MDLNDLRTFVVITLFILIFTSIDVRPGEKKDISPGSSQALVLSAPVHVEPFGLIAMDHGGRTAAAGLRKRRPFLYTLQRKVMVSFEVCRDPGHPGIVAIDRFGALYGSEGFPMTLVQEPNQTPVFRALLMKDLQLVYDEKNRLQGCCVLDKYGGVHFGGKCDKSMIDAKGSLPYWEKQDRAARIKLVYTRSGKILDLLMLDVFGQVYSFRGTLPFSSEPFFKSNLARDFEPVVTTDGTLSGIIVLDGYGILHSLGKTDTFVAAVSKSLPSWQGWDIARDLELVYDKNGEPAGCLVLDGYGGVHYSGRKLDHPVPDLPTSFYQKTDHAITLRIINR